MEGEDSDTASDREHDEVLVQREAFLKERDVEKHDGEEFARLCEDEGDVVNVGKGCIAEGGRETRSNGYEEQRKHNFPRRKYRRRRSAFGGVGA